MSPIPEDLAARRRELLRRRLVDAGLTGSSTTERIPRRQPDRDIPLSFAQSRMWFLQQLEPDNPAYNVCLTIRLSGLLDVAALDTAFHRLALRHEVLRTRYEVGAEGQPVQVVDPDPSFAFDVVDLGELDRVARARRVEELVRAESAAPFELSRDHPLRVRLVRQGADGHLLLTVHHIVWDGGTFGVLSAELSALYREAATGEPAALAPLSVQYADVAVWQRHRWTPQRLTDHLDYWRTQLTPLPEPLQLPTDGRRAVTVSARGGRRCRTVGPGPTAQLIRLGEATGATPFMVLLAGFAAVLSRYTGATDVPIGSPSMNRETPELAGLIGNFVNTLVLRVDLSGDPSVTELLQRVQRICVDGYAHQELPFDKLVDDLAPVRQPGRSVLFDVMLVLVAQGLQGPQLPGVRGWELVHNGTTQFDLALEALLTDGRLRIEATYRSELFAADTVDRMLEHLEVLLTAAVADPDQPVSRLELLSAAERDRMLREWNDTATPMPSTTLTGLFEAQAGRSPQATAVEYGDTRVRYAELNARANRLARRLVDLGVGPERCVGVHLERSVELVVALLAVEKAGGAFVPLEPSWPACRIAEVCDDARPVVVLSRTRDLAAVSGRGVAVLGVGPEDFAAAEVDEENLGVPVDPEALAYVIYTSGSTGAPKGAMIRHRAIAHRLIWQRRLLGFGGEDAALFKAPLGFDISVNEIFLPLTTGGRLVIAEPGAERDVEYLLDTIAGHRVTFVYLVSSMLDLLLALDDFDVRAASLQHVWCGGEVLTPELFRRFRRHSTAVMYHGYGPAEATIGVSHVVYRSAAVRSAISIGRPNTNTRLHVLDRRLQPVPLGVTGELYAGGVYLGRGYLNDPRRTACCFVADPFGPPGSRVYRTGDLARWRSDGTLEFLGRADNQVKIRGMRVELEEIEAVLEQHEQIRRAVVLLREDQPGVQRLVGYGLAEAPGLAGEQVRAWLSARLPEHMVPQSFVLLPEFPLMASGKVDRGQLPAPQVGQDPDGAPVTEEETLLCRLFAETLALSAVGVRDNFFALGGDSILSIRLVNRARKAGVLIKVGDVFGNQTPAGLATVVAARPSADAVTKAPDPADRPLVVLTEQDLDDLEA
ncbi:MAG: non-ribosomal peptide synthetase [Pseudonocardiaceae bacterium]